MNDLFLAKTNYNFNQANERHAGNGMSTLFCNYEQKVSNSILQLALVDDADFWANHENFGVVTFLNEIAKLNDIRHAEKVLSFIAENLQKMPHLKQSDTWIWLLSYQNIFQFMTV